MFKNRINAARALLASGFLIAGTAAHAELPTAVSGAITTYQEDATTAIGLLMAAGVVIWGLLALKRKLGW